MKNCDESQASSMSQEEDFGIGTDNSEDVDPVQFNIDESANCKANTATYGEGSESDDSSDSEDTGTKTLASEILNRFQKWLESLLDAIKIRDVFLGERADEKYSPATIKSSLTSLQHYCSYLLGDQPSDVIFNTEDVIGSREKLRRWSYSYTKETMRRRWEKHEEDVSVLITPEKIKDCDASQASRDAVIILGELGGNTVVEMNQSKYTLVRDYLIAQIMIDNVNCAGVVSAMTVKEFQRARVEDERYVVRVLKHKTVDTYGPPRVVLTKFLCSYINVFIKQMRPLLHAALSYGKQALFLS